MRLQSAQVPPSTALSWHSGGQSLTEGDEASINEIPANKPGTDER